MCRKINGEKLGETDTHFKRTKWQLTRCFEKGSRWSAAINVSNNLIGWGNAILGPPTSENVGNKCARDALGIIKFVKYRISGALTIN